MGEPENRCLLGDIDDHGSALMDSLETYVSSVNITVDTKRLRYLSSKVEGDELLAIFENGQAGVDAIIRTKTGETKAHQEIDDSQDIECGCLFHLPRNSRTGWLALHVPNRRGIKTLLGTHIRRLFREQFPELNLEITPVVLESALKQAIDQNLIEKVTLVKRVDPSDRAMEGIDQWVGEEDYGKIQVVIGARLKGRAQALLPHQVRRYLEGDTAALRSIVAFRGMTFDEAKVTVHQGDTTRTFNIEQLESGHPLTEDMHLGPGKPSPEQIFTGLRRALQTVLPSA